MLRGVSRANPAKARGMNLKQMFPFVLAALCLQGPAWAGTSFQHIIIVVQENRTPDNLFYGLCADPNACAVPPASGQYNIQTSAWLDETSPTGTTDPHSVPLGIGYDLGHFHKAFLNMCDMNGGSCALDWAGFVRGNANTPSFSSKPPFRDVDKSGRTVP